MIFSAEHLLSSCFTSVTIPIVVFSSALMATVMNALSASLLESRSEAMKSRMSSTVLKESLSWIRESVPNCDWKDQQKIVREAVPQKISEAEPKDVSKR